MLEVFRCNGVSGCGVVIGAGGVQCIIVFYCTSYRLNMFRALLCPSSGAHDYNINYHIGGLVLGLL